MPCKPSYRYIRAGCNIVRKFTMDISIETYEKELLIEALEYRIENDERLIRDYSTKEELTYLLEKLAEGY